MPLARISPSVMTPPAMILPASTPRAILMLFRPGRRELSRPKQCGQGRVKNLLIGYYEQENKFLPRVHR